MQEIERKFLVADEPSDLQGARPSEIAQGYLIAFEDTEVRLRRKGSRLYLTLKKGKGLSREECEVELSAEQFEALWPATGGQRLEKRRYALDWQGHTIELDIYLGALQGLMTAEVEFGSVAESRAFSPPDWFAQEVTEDERFKNKNLALGGRRPEI